MPEITFRPLKEIVIAECTRYAKPEHLAMALSAAFGPGQPVYLSWAEGVVFIPGPIPVQSETMAKEFMAGRVYWVSVAFAQMPVFQPTVRVGGLEIPIIDVSASETMRSAAAWLKSRPSGEGK